MRCLLGIDDESVLNVVEDYLKQIDKFIHIESTSNLEVVQRLLTENEYDFMIASCCQHKDYSQQLLAWIRAKKIDIEVIYATRYNDSDHVQKAFRHGVCDYILLPFTFERFNLAIQRVIEKILFLNSRGPLTQKEVDDYMAISTRPQIKKPLHTKGINNATLQKIEKCIGSCISSKTTTFTASEVAECVSLSRITVRRYLEEMVANNELEVRMEYGSIGRPHKLYVRKQN